MCEASVVFLCVPVHERVPVNVLCYEFVCEGCGQWDQRAHGVVPLVHAGGIVGGVGATVLILCIALTL